MSNDEVGKLTIAFNHMVEDLRAKDRIKETFGKFVDPRIVANLIDPAGGSDLAERQLTTVFFSDIREFSSLGELLTATTLVKLLNTYFSEMTALIHARNGIIDKFVGDGLMAFWTAPFSRGESHATDACLAALAQQDAIQKLSSPKTMSRAVRSIFLPFSARSNPSASTRLMAPVGCLSAAEDELRRLFAEGLAAYRARDWDQSEPQFAQCLAVVPTDGPAAVFRHRFELLRGKTLPPDWDGVWQLTENRSGGKREQNSIENEPRRPYRLLPISVPGL
jgi:hypothetical protein